MDNEGAERYLRWLFYSLGRLDEHAPSNEAPMLQEAIQVAISAYAAAGILTAEEAQARRKDLVALIKR